MAPPLGTDPDDVVDFLPKPYRELAKVLEEVWENVGVEIHEIEKRRRSAEYEFGLPQVHADASYHIMGRVTCVAMDPRGANRLALGTDQGQVLIVDCKQHRTVVQKAPFESEEEVLSIVMTASTTYQLHAKSDSVDIQKRPCPKLAVVGSASAKILVYDIRKEFHGPALLPLCSVDLQLPAWEPAGDDAEAAPPRPVLQLCACGSLGALWVAALHPGGACSVYLCPPGPAEVRGGKLSSETIMGTTIYEDQEEGHTGAAEFSAAEVVATPLFKFDLPSMVPMPGLPEPPLSSAVLRLFGVAPERRASLPAPLPVVLLVASTSSNVLQSLNLQRPEPAVPQDGDADAVVRNVAPFVLGALKQPVDSLQPGRPRRWELPAKTTAVAVSGNCAVFAAGGADGFLALFHTTPGPSLKAMLSGHYAAVSAMSFHGAKVLLTVGQDSWVHHYSVVKQVLEFRCLLSPPPVAPPAVDTIAAPTLPIGLALDERGNLRLLDLRLGRKLASALCAEAEGAAARPPRVRRVRQILASSGGFCALCVSEPLPDAKEAGCAPKDPLQNVRDSEEPKEPESQGGKEDHQQNVELHFFDFRDMLCQLFPGIKARVTEDARVDELFQSLSAEEMQSAPAAGATLPRQGPEANMMRRDSEAKSRGSHMSSAGVKRTNTQTLSPQRKASTTQLSPQRRASTTQFSPQMRMSTQLSAKTGTVRVATQTPSAMSGSSEPPSAPLTAANIERVQGGREGERRGGGRPRAAAGAARLLPESWQAGVRSALRRQLAEKDAREKRCQEHIEGLRRRLEQAA